MDRVSRSVRAVWVAGLVSLLLVRSAAGRGCFCGKLPAACVQATGARESARIEP